jgi:NAD(P)-dependent dehydrogenase (short-subunit alcohol dehydrogenase family)
MQISLVVALDRAVKEGTTVGAMDEVTGKVAVVTGGASGIGLALARRFATEGMKVVIGDVEAGALDVAVKGLAEDFGDDDVAGVVTDVREPASVEALAAATFDRFGTAHVVCNNAGVAVGGFSWEIPADRWRWIVDVNLLGVVNGVRAFVPRMIEQGEGHVVNTASIAGIATAPVMSPYVATKHGVVALSESLHFDLQVTGHGDEVGVSVLCPEWVRTNIADAERNRPDDVSAMVLPEGVEEGQGRSIIGGFVEGGLDPAEVAGKVFDAIRERRFWIFTHDTSVDTVRRRFDAITSDGQPTFWGQADWAQPEPDPSGGE